MSATLLSTLRARNEPTVSSDMESGRFGFIGSVIIPKAPLIMPVRHSEKKSAREGRSEGRRLSWSG